MARQVTVLRHAIEALSNQRLQPADAPVTFRERSLAILGLIMTVNAYSRHAD